ncbi:MAG: DUF2589 domain-containing protein [Paludibacteraceae bacterium]|nr:DUF2589 domain-containing protein [Paludibacteraceae bacterium]
MAIDTSAAIVATNALQSIPFGSIIGGPLSACIEAQANAAKTSWEFIKEVGLISSEDGTEKKAVYVNFEYRKDGRHAVLSVPLLTIVPIPFLAIRDIDIAFKANISASSSVSTTVSKSTAVDASAKISAGVNLGLFKGSMEMSASVSSKKDSTATRDSKYSVEYTMDVAVKAGQDDMPAGMSKVLQMLNESIESVAATGELSVSAKKISHEDGGVYVTYKNTEGYYEPSAIKVYDISDDEDKEIEDTSIANVITDETGAVCLLKQVGKFKIKAGEKSCLIEVV